MTDWANQEGVRLQKALEAKRATTEKNNHAKDVKRSQGLRLWGETVKAASKLVEQLNAAAGSNILLWRSQNDQEIDVIAPDFGEKCNVHARFNAPECKITWQCFRANREELAGIVGENDQLMWNDGSHNLTTEKAAEKIMADLTKSIT